MKRFRDLKIRIKMLTGFLSLATIMIAVGVVGILNIQKVDGNYASLYENFGVSLNDIGDAAVSFQRIRVNVLSMTADTQGNTRTYLSNIDNYERRMDRDLKKFAGTVKTSQVRQLFGRLLSARNSYEQVKKRVLKLALAGQREAAFRISVTEGKYWSEEINGLFDRISQDKIVLGRERSNGLTKETRGTVWLMTILIALGTGLGVALGIIISRMIARPIGEMMVAADRLARGDVNVNIEATTKDEIGSLMGSFGAMVANIQEQAVTADRIARGDLTVEVKVRSEQDILGKKLAELLQTSQNLIRETDQLARAAQEGRLDTRGHAEAFNGSWSELVMGVNATLDAVIGPLNVAAEYVDRISKGDIPPKITDTYYGDFNEIKNNLNMCIGTIDALISEAHMLAGQASAGNLTVRGDAAKFNGGYAQIIDGFNKTLDAVIVPLNEAQEVLGRISLNDYTLEMVGQYQGNLKEFKESINMTRTRLLSVQDAVVRASKGDVGRLDEFKKIGKRSENDQLMPSLAALYQTIQDIINEVDMLSQAGINGELKVRGTAQRFEGGFRQIVEGLNHTLDAFVAPITECSAVLQEMSAGNLQVGVKGDYKGDHALLKDALNQAIESFNEVLLEFNNAAEQVASGAKDVSGSSQALSQGSAEQASTVEEISASVTEIATQTRQNAANASQASELASSARDQAGQGNAQMKEMLRAMDAINESSASISKIIKVIDEIAFQTNILALNAAVEAARAGQHGKGFAVVAEEVRNLAARSAGAAKETTALIEGSIKKVEMGTRIANDTAKALEQIVEGVNKATTLVGEIASASNEQATGIAQINQGITQVSQVTQGNTTVAEQSASASEELASQAQILREMVQRFKIKGMSSLGTPMEKARKSPPDKNGTTRSGSNGYAESTKKNRISLDDTEFSKY